MAHLKDLQENFHEVEDQIRSDFNKFERPIQLLDSILGIDLSAAFAILAEISHDMTTFPTAQHIRTCAGLPPGNHESAGKKKNNGLPQVIIISKTILCEVARVIAAHKDQYLSSWY